MNQTNKKSDYDRKLLKITCPKCGSSETTYDPEARYYSCDRCFFEWSETITGDHIAQLRFTPPLA
ncbi:hypothetical protein [Fischerella sp. PCC 9605]|uniref:hypothetical protein n=1 Tax=Fischerella sp. PCC 9605 TaxID=1173024 RepID=UPI00047E0FC8|nr:hypothetical protein [Fischerella sp. PCC 9605]